LEFEDLLGEKQTPPDPSAGNGNGSGTGNEGDNNDVGDNDNGWEAICEWLQDQISELQYEESQLAVLGSCLDAQSSARLQQLTLLFEEYCIDPFNKPDRSYDPVEPYDANDCSTCEVNNPAPPIVPPRTQIPGPQNVLPPAMRRTRFFRPLSAENKMDSCGLLSSFLLFVCRSLCALKPIGKERTSRTPCCPSSLSVLIGFQYLPPQAV